MASRCQGEHSSKVVWLTLWLACVGCSQAVMLTHETDTNGVVTYLYKENRGGPMGSPYRKEALKVMEKKCPSGYSVIKEGETRGGYSNVSSLEGLDEEGGSRRWGLQFRCKA